MNVGRLPSGGDEDTPAEGSGPTTVTTNSSRAPRGWAAHSSLATRRMLAQNKGVPRSFPTWLPVFALSGTLAAAVVEGPSAHWAYQPLSVRPTPAAAHPGDSGLGWMDHQLNHAARAHGLEPAPEADRATLCRRLHLVLTGLPPTPEELQSFLADRSVDPVARRADELLASPRFGERWARHWLDVARYADSVTLRGFVFKESWRYRDFVIDSFNADLPFDQFVREQVAGDLLERRGLEERRRGLIATTFWTLGDTNLEEQDKRQLELDVVDEQLDVLGKAFLGQTISCARCHDHKFDPIPTRDYHALAGILSGMRMLKHSNVSEWTTRPLPGTPDEERAWSAAEGRVRQLEADLKAARAAAAAKPANGVAPPGIVVDDSKARAVGDWTVSTHTQPFVGEGYRHDGNAGKGTRTLTFQPEFPRSAEYEIRFAYTPGENRSPSVPVTLFSADGERTVRIDERQPPDLPGGYVSLGRARFEKGVAGFVLVSNEGTAGHVVADAVLFIPVDDAAAPAPAPVANETDQPSPNRPSVRELERALASARAGTLRPHAMAPMEVGATNLPILRRGNWRNTGETVPHGVLSVAFRSPVPPPHPGESGRRELAEWLVHPENPLTSRVYVNRVWHWVFGVGLVRSTDHFGTTGDAPTHQDLLDGLAAEFMRDGWSVKRLVRQLVTSQAFRRSSDPAHPTVTTSISADPGNQWLARFAPRRAEAEVLQDSMRWVAGTLDSSGHGEPGFPSSLAADYGHVATENRRSIYQPVFRNARPEGLTTFDSADPCRVTGARESSAVAPQALYFLNHPFVREQAAATTQRLLQNPKPIDELWLRSLGRPPTTGERRHAEQHLAAATDQGVALTELVQALFGSVDFRLIP